MPAAKPRVHLMGGEGTGWALDDDLRLTRVALEPLVEVVPLAQAEVIHSVWWQPLLRLKPEQVQGKKIICHVPNWPINELKHPQFHRLNGTPGLHWVAISSQGQAAFEGCGIASTYIPYTVDAELFRPLPPDAPELADLRARWGIPAEAYLIGSFQRDSDGRDRGRPKPQKAPEVFAEIVAAVRQAGCPVHVVLAGPRRGWLRARLEALDVPYTFIGQNVPPDQDDTGVNILPQRELVKLYNLIDLYLITSRWEGGPRAVLECAASGCKILTTRVGQAADVLEPASLFDTPEEAIAAVLADAAHGTLDGTPRPQRQRTLAGFLPQHNTPRFEALYQSLEGSPVISQVQAWEAPAAKALTRRALERLRLAPRLRVATWGAPLPADLVQHLTTARLCLRPGDARAEAHIVSGVEGVWAFQAAGISSRAVLQRLESDAAEAELAFNRALRPLSVVPSGTALARLAQVGLSRPVIVPLEALPPEEPGAYLPPIAETARVYITLLEMIAERN